MAVLYTAFAMDQLSLEMPFALIFYNLNNNFMFHSWVTALASGNKEVVKWASLESSATVSSEAGVPPLMPARHSDTGDFHCTEKKICPSLTFWCLGQREMCATFKRQPPPPPCHGSSSILSSSGSGLGPSYQSPVSYVHQPTGNYSLS